MRLSISHRQKIWYLFWNMLPHIALIIKLINHNRSLPEKIIMIDDESQNLIIWVILPMIISILVLMLS